MRVQKLQPKALAIMLAAAFPFAATSTTSFAAENENEFGVVVSAPRITSAPKAAGELRQDDLSFKLPSTSDSAQLFRDVPGVTLSGAGGVSSLPVIHGLADDRNRIKIDGMDLISACGNHMNPPLSYIDPSNVESAKVYAGLTPVSIGGDSIGGTIVVNSHAPRFANSGEGLLTAGELGAFYRSNGNARGAHASATLANENLSIRYDGSTAQSENYKSARKFKDATDATWTKAGVHRIDGDEVGSSAYKTENQSLGIALRSNDHVVDFKIGWQHIPYQGFPNQHMDMVDNQSTQLNLGYKGQFFWGNLQARIYREETRHKMDFADDKTYWYGLKRNSAGMPMDTKGENTGALVKAEILLNDRDTMRTGVEYQRYRLNDWWPPVANSMMMGPNTFENINDGQRDRFDIFAEWEALWSGQWMTLAGVRSSTLKMDTGDVQGYNTMPGYSTDASRFNAADHTKRDNNIDLMALARYTPDSGQTYEGGYSRKTRSPSLYERYTWSTNGMAMTMNNWVNDGNGYVGDLALKPEVAHTLGFSADLHDGRQKEWGFRVTPYYSRVDNYIDATCLKSCTQNRFNYLKLVNTDARLYGVDLSGFASLGKVGGMGDFSIKGVVGYVNGRNTHSDDNLYNIMPLNARLTLEHRSGNWTNAMEEVLVSAKDDVSHVRNEMKTAGYGLLNLRSSYETKHYRFDMGIENATNKQYAMPLGGAYIGQGTTMALNGAGAPYGIPMPGMGRSIYAGLNVKF